MKEHFLLFVRQGSVGALSNFVVLRVVYVPKVLGQEETSEAIVARLRAAVTEWITQTASGREAYASTAEDFNVGDLVGYLYTKPLGVFLAKHGIKSADGVQSGDSAFSYDKHLFIGLEEATKND